MDHDKILFEKKWDELRLFEQKILQAIGRRVCVTDSNTKAYTLHLTEFGLDMLNPSDITERLRGLRNKSIPMRFDHQYAQVPLITDVQYDDSNKTVTITFNSILKNGYAAIGEKSSVLRNFVEKQRSLITIKSEK